MKRPTGRKVAGAHCLLHRTRFDEGLGSESFSAHSISPSGMILFPHDHYSSSSHFPQEVHRCPSETVAKAMAAAGVSFIPSEKCVFELPGYVFRPDTKGLGYYLKYDVEVEKARNRQEVSQMADVVLVFQYHLEARTSGAQAWGRDS